MCVQTPIPNQRIWKLLKFPINASTSSFTPTLMNWPSERSKTWSKSINCAKQKWCRTMIGTKWRIPDSFHRRKTHFINNQIPDSNKNIDVVHYGFGLCMYANVSRFHKTLSKIILGQFMYNDRSIIMRPDDQVLN